MTDSIEEWRLIETIAEENPYVIALLNPNYGYVCSGATISRHAVLTSGHCTATPPSFVAVGLAILSKEKHSNIFAVSHTLLHDDYIYIMDITEPSGTKMHSNIGLVFIIRPILDLFLPPATIGSYFASELSEVELTAVGYGRRRVEEDDTDIFILQYQLYEQSTCLNPRWYYCICGTEVDSAKSTHGGDFGNGAPVLLGTDVVCITATSSHLPVLRSTGVSFNIFTVIGPYIPWMEKTEIATKVEETRSEKRSQLAKSEALTHADYYHTLLHAIYMFLIVRLHV